MAVKVLAQNLNEGSTGTYTAVLTDESGTAIDIPTDATAMTLDYYRTDTGASINSRLAQDVLGGGTGAANHTLDASGNLTFKLTTADTTLSLTADLTVRLRYTLTYNDGAAVSRTSIHEAEFKVLNLATVT